MNNSIEFISLKAKQGDAFVIKWGGNNAMLIDGGMPSTLKQIEDTIENCDLKFIFVSHVDYDHIAGLIKLVEQPSFNMTNIEHYMNYPELALSPDDDTQVSFAHGENYATLLDKKGCKAISITDQDRISKFNVDIQVLTPNQTDLDKLLDDWNANRIIKDENIEYLKKQVSHGDIINKTSVSLLINIQELKFLMLADSHPQDIIDKLEDMGYGIDNPLNVDILKLSHHGSRHNTTVELLKRIKTENYYISTNGAKYDHPDEEIFECIIEAANFHNSKESNIFTNYEIESEIKLKVNSDYLSRINIIHQERIKYNAL